MVEELVLRMRYFYGWTSITASKCDDLRCFVSAFETSKPKAIRRVMYVASLLYSYVLRYNDKKRVNVPIECIKV